MIRGAVRAALRPKEAAYRRFRRNPSPSSQAEFADRRREFKTVSNDKYFEYLRNLTDDFKTNPKRYWSFLKSITVAAGSSQANIPAVAPVENACAMHAVWIRTTLNGFYLCVAF